MFNPGGREALACHEVNKSLAPGRAAGGYGIIKNEKETDTSNSSSYYSKP